MKLKKVLALVLGTCMLMTSITGCGGTDTTEETEVVEEEVVESEEAEEETVKSDVTLTIMAAQDQIKDVEIDVIAPLFEEETGIKIDFQIIPSDQYDDLLATKLDTGAVTDIFVAQSGALTMESRYNPVENCVDLSNESWVSSYHEVAAEACSLDGVLYAQTIYNVEASVWALVYNKTMFDEYGIEVPTTYDEFVEACETLLAQDIVPLYQAGVDSWHAACSLVEAFVQVEYDNPGTFEQLNNNEITFAEVPGALEIVEQCNEVGQLYSGDTYLSNEYANAAASLASGEYAMVVDRPTLITQIANEYPDELYGSESDYAVALIPCGDNQILPVNPQAPSRFVYSGGEHIEEALAYLEFCAQPEILELFIEGEESFTMLPFDGVDGNLNDYEVEFFSTYVEVGTVTQAGVSYVDPQWMDIAKDIQSLYLDQITAEDLLNNIDDLRTSQAETAGDENW